MSGRIFNNELFSKLTQLAMRLVFIGLVVSVLAVIFTTYRSIAWAISSNYSKTAGAPGNTLTADQWNNLRLDFIAKSGDTMEGDIDMGNVHHVTNLAVLPAGDTDAVSRGWVAAEIASRLSAVSVVATDRNGNSLDMVCGNSGVNWGAYTTGGLTDFNTSVAGFTQIPVYLTSIRAGDTGRHWEPSGPPAIYSVNAAAPTDIMGAFRVYFRGSDLNPNIYYDDANDGGWNMDWCGIGN